MMIRLIQKLTKIFTKSATADKIYQFTQKKHKKQCRMLRSLW